MFIDFLRRPICFWRSRRDSNPGAFWANGFQDRLVMTTSIQLHVLLFSCQLCQNKSSGVTLGAHLRFCNFNEARQVPILLGLYRKVKSRSTGFQDRLVMTTSIQLRTLKALKYIRFVVGFQLCVKTRYPSISRSLSRSSGFL